MSNSELMERAHAMKQDYLEAMRLLGAEVVRCEIEVRVTGSVLVASEAMENAVYGAEADLMGQYEGSGVWLRNQVDGFIGERP